jgi:hypothetical protein
MYKFDDFIVSYGLITPASNGQTGLDFRGSGTAPVGETWHLWASGTELLRGQRDPYAALVVKPGVTLEISDSFRLANLTSAQRDSLGPLKGLTIFNTETDQVEVCKAGGWSGVGGGVSSIGTYDSQPADAKGLVVSGSSIYAQSADATHPGMIKASGIQTLGVTFALPSLILVGPVSSAAAVTDPTSIANLKLWFDGSDSSSMIVSSGSVSQWNDKSGSGFNATQGTGANRPTLVTNVLNGKSVVRFDGSDDYLSFGTSQVFNDTLGYTVITVFKCTATGFAKTLFEANAGNSRWLRYDVAIGDTTYGDISVSTNNGDANVRTGAILSTSSFAKIVVTYNGSGNATPSNYVIAKNNTIVASHAAVKEDTNVNPLAGSAFVAGTANKIGIYGDGSSNPFQGDIAEIILYNRKLTDNELASLTAYLKAKWNI